MDKVAGSHWSRLGWVEQAFAVAAVLFAVMRFGRILPAWEPLVAVLTVVLGVIAAVRVGRKAMRRAIWRLRNRMIAAYVFIAVVPIVLIVTLVWEAGQFVIGQMAVYLANAELTRSINALAMPAQVLAHAPGGEFEGVPFGRGGRGGRGGRFREPGEPNGRAMGAPEAAGQAGRRPLRGMRDPEVLVARFAPMVQRTFPAFEVRVSGEENFAYPEDATITQPPDGWKGDRGLMVRREGTGQRLYAWAHATGDGGETTVVAPVDHAWLSRLVQGLGDINIAPYTKPAPETQIPQRANPIDFEVSGVLPLDVPSWDAGRADRRAVLVVNSRASAVLGVVLGNRANYGEVMMTVFATISALFLMVEIASLWAGIKLTRTMTGAVYELYEGTQRIKEGDFTHRIPVKGDDQMAELQASFNTMTENLGRLIVVAKEKERLESELAIAREVQGQLFPKDVPFTKTLELKGVCNPARMVSGDYYDFMALSETALAFAIGDVAGKGISAALLMAAIQSTMRTQLNALDKNCLDDCSTAQLVANLNRQLYATTAPEKYATFYFGLYNEASHSLTYTNAGHLSPMLLRGGDVLVQDSTGTVVGAFPFARYDEKTVPLEHGDILVAYTDGIVEPENAYGEMFGEDRLKDLLVRYAKSDSSEMIARVMEAVNQWTGSSELQDDMTMLVARRL